MRAFIRQFAIPLLGFAAIALLASVLVFAVAMMRSAPSSPASEKPLNPLDAYRELGTWIDLWDARAWNDPAGTVKDAADHGVRTLFIQTGNARSTSGISNPAAMREFIKEAHAHKMYVIAWYLPTLKTGSVDYERFVQAIEFSTEDGQKFDSFALDIESTAVKPVSARNESLLELSARMRKRVGAKYPLGAITPSPVGLRKQTGFWNVFPWREVAGVYDVLVPMAYYSYDSRSATQARTYALSSMKIIRAQPGCSTIPVHLIGGISNGSSAAEVRAFTKAARETGCIGASNYDWAGMNSARWKALTDGWDAGGK